MAEVVSTKTLADLLDISESGSKILAEWLIAVRFSAARDDILLAGKCPRSPRGSGAIGRSPTKLTPGVDGLHVNAVLVHGDDIDRLAWLLCGLPGNSWLPRMPSPVRSKGKALVNA